MTQSSRSEHEVLQQMTDIERALLKRILEIERAKLHITAHDPTDDLVRVVKEIIP
ncbi:MULTISPECIES: hypothetical protein [unclassified Blastococcus]